ncbi:hypothetical protein PanWU01x14_274940 [Parasponia andersonii]|uniref:Uncharacterized protein n=1 Tax=Parasponia andersonii TaxID=3476 RepID=A0A2P5B3G9_PARAD|nr:hypothetical protein PanWU01x14_274940 [Parasponia andersonii]
MLTSYQVQRDAIVRRGSSSSIKMDSRGTYHEMHLMKSENSVKYIRNLFDPKMDEVNPVRPWKKLRNGLICGDVAKGSWPATLSKPFSKLFPPRIGLVSIPARAPAPLQLCG